MADCLLCKVVSGELQVNRILETDNAIGIVNDLEPMSRGHCVFFPKRHTPQLHDMDDRELSEVLALVKKVARAMELENYNVLQNNGSLANQTVFHAHFHLIPKWSETEGLRYNRDFPNRIDQREISQRIKEKLSRTG
jgi:diadenosine tetraphosphate (Ap4A) HIT family hydrolase